MENKKSEKDKRIKAKISNFAIANKWKIVSFLIVALLAANIATVFLYRREKAMNVKVNPYPLIDFSRNFIPQEDFIVNLQPLREKIKSMAGEFGNESVSIYIEYLNTGANISVNPNKYIWPASLNKLPVAMVAMKKIEKGDWKLSNELVLMHGDRNYESGDKNNMLAEYPDGTRFTIEKLLEESLAQSDNTAYYILRRNLHDDEILEFAGAIGLDEVSDEEGKISAKEYSRIFRSLYSASFLDRKNSEKILGWLDVAPFDKFLAGSIPENIMFPHKYGEQIQQNVYSDSGIVYLPNRPYMITVMTQGSEESPYEEELKKASEFMRRVSEETYEYFSKYGR